MVKRNIFRKPNQATITQNQTGFLTPLAHILPGGVAQMVSFDEKLPPNRRIHLVAYGLSPGIWVEVLQQSPVTIIRIENTELALEKDLAKSVLCQA